MNDNVWTIWEKFLRHDRFRKTFKQDKIGMIHAASTLFWTDVPRSNQCTCIAEMQTCLSCSCELAVTVKVTPKKCTWMSVVAITSQRTSKCSVEQSRTRSKSTSLTTSEFSVSIRALHVFIVQRQHSTQSFLYDISYIYFQNTQNNPFLYLLQTPYVSRFNRQNPPIYTRKRPE